MATVYRNVERSMLDKYISETRRVRIIIQNGFQIRGIIRKQDDVVILVEDDENKPKESLIYKEGISTIVPI